MMRDTTYGLMTNILYLSLKFATLRLESVHRSRAFHFTELALLFDFYFSNSVRNFTHFYR